MKLGIFDSVSRFRYRMRVEFLHIIYMEKNKIMGKNKRMSTKKSGMEYTQTNSKTITGRKNYKS